MSKWVECIDNENVSFIKKGDKYLVERENSSFYYITDITGKDGKGYCKERFKLCDSPILIIKSEEDPSGKDQHEAGAKLDQGKNRLGLVLGDFAHALEEVGKVGTFGADKYTDHGWRKVPNGILRYTDAMARHFLQESTKGKRDQDSKMLHAAQVAWNALARLELMVLEDKGLPVPEKKNEAEQLDLGPSRSRSGDLCGENGYRCGQVGCTDCNA